jgi:hypothetical protein
MAELAQQDGQGGAHRAGADDDDDVTLDLQPPSLLQAHGANVASDSGPRLSDVVADPSCGPAGSQGQTGWTQPTAMAHRGRDQICQYSRVV